MSESFGFLDNPKIIIKGLGGIQQISLTETLIGQRFWAFKLKLCVYLRLTKIKVEREEEESNLLPFTHLSAPGKRFSKDQRPKFWRPFWFAVYFSIL